MGSEGRQTPVTICLAGTQEPKPSPRRIQLLLLKVDSGGRVAGGSTSPSVIAKGGAGRGGELALEGGPAEFGVLAERSGEVTKCREKAAGPGPSVPCHPSQTPRNGGGVRGGGVRRQLPWRGRSPPPAQAGRAHRPHCLCPPKVPWDDLRYLFGEIMYGGHITDDWDRRLCRTYLVEYIRAEMLEGEIQLAPGFQIPPNLDYKVKRTDPQGRPSRKHELAL